MVRKVAVAVERSAPLLLAGIFDWARLCGIAAGISDQDVDRPQRVLDVAAHVLDRLGDGLLDRAGLEILAAEVRYPHDSYCLARFADPADPPANAHWLDPGHPVWRRSPFRIDRAQS